MNTLAQKIREYTDMLSPIVLEEVDSTNAYVRSLAKEGAPEGTAVIALKQTAGRGRLGRSFYSPEGGIYLSLLLRPQIPPTDTLLITVAAAVAAADAIESTSGTETKIKWVNDIYVDDKKVCGILTEGAISEKQTLDFAVLGIGINLSTPNGGFPADLPRAGSVFGEAEATEETKAQIIARFAEEFFKHYKNLGKKEFMIKYKEKSFLNGKTIEFEREGAVCTARVLEIDDNAALIVECEGETVALFSGDAQIKDFN